jgi:hypothetical protein
VHYRDVGLPVRSVEVVGGGEAAVLGHIQVPLMFGGKRIVAELIVVEGIDDLLLGSDVLTQLGVMRAVGDKLSSAGVQVRVAKSAPAVAASAIGGSGCWKMCTRRRMPLRSTI